MTERIHSLRFEAFSLPQGHLDETARCALLAALPPVPYRLRERTVSITFLAGAGTRWKASLAEAKARAVKVFGAYHDIQNEHDETDTVRRAFAAPTLEERSLLFGEKAPRGLFPVPDFLRGRDGSRLVAMAAYAFDAVRRIEHHIVVVRGWEKEIDELALAPADIQPQSRIFFTQRGGQDGQVFGHGDATMQCESLWKDSQYVVTNFAGDANSALTVELALRAFAQFDAMKLDIGAIIPVAHVETPSYPVYLNEEGYPVGFWHSKLAGEKPRSVPAPLTNVGIRVYRADMLARALHEMASKYRTRASINGLEGLTTREAGADLLWNIPGNDPSKHECALDNIDNHLAAQGLVRVMPISLPRELTPMKELGEYRNFVLAAREVQEELSAARL